MLAENDSYRFGKPRAPASPVPQLSHFLHLRVPPVRVVRIAPIFPSCASGVIRLILYPVNSLCGPIPRLATPIRARENPLVRLRLPDTSWMLKESESFLAPRTDVELDSSRRINPTPTMRRVPTNWSVNQMNSSRWASRGFGSKVSINAAADALSYLPPVSN